MSNSSSTGLVSKLSPSLSGKQRQHLRQLGHHLNPVVLIGQNSIETNEEQRQLKETIFDNVRNALLSHELIKIKGHDSDDLPFVAQAIYDETGAQLIQMIGKTMLFYQAHPDTPKIRLPKK